MPRSFLVRKYQKKQQLLKEQSEKSKHVTVNTTCISPVRATDVLSASVTNNRLTAEKDNARLHVSTVPNEDDTIGKKKTSVEPLPKIVPRGELK